MKGLPDLHPSQIKGDGTMRGAAVLALAASPSGSVYAVLCQTPNTERGYTTHAVNRDSGAIGNGRYGMTYGEALENLADRARPI